MSGSSRHPGSRWLARIGLRGDLRVRVRAAAAGDDPLVQRRQLPDLPAVGLEPALVQGADRRSEIPRRSVRSASSVALVVVALSLAAGIPAAIALARGRLPIGAALETLLLAPLILPTIVIGLSILLVFSQVRLAASYTGLVLAHLAITLPFTVRILTTTLAHPAARHRGRRRYARRRALRRRSAM